MNNNFQRRVVLRNEAQNWNDPHIQLDRNSPRGLSRTVTNDGYNDSHQRYDNFVIDKPIRRVISTAEDSSYYGYRNRDDYDRNRDDYDRNCDDYDRNREYFDQNNDGYDHYHNQYLLANDSSKRRRPRVDNDSGRPNLSNYHPNQPRSVSPVNQFYTKPNSSHYRNYPNSSSNQNYSNPPSDIQKNCPFDGLDSLSKSFSGNITQRPSSSSDTHQHNFDQRSQPQHFRNRPREQHSHHMGGISKTFGNIRREHQVSIRKSKSPKQPIILRAPSRSKCSEDQGGLYDDLSDEENRKLTSDVDLTSDAVDLTLDAVDLTSDVVGLTSDVVDITSFETSDAVDITEEQTPQSYTDNSINDEPSKPPESKNTEDKEDSIVKPSQITVIKDKDVPIIPWMTDEIRKRMEENDNRFKKWNISCSTTSPNGNKELHTRYLDFDKELKAFITRTQIAYQLMKTEGTESSGYKAESITSCSSTMESSTTISSLKSKEASNCSKTVNTSKSDIRAGNEYFEPIETKALDSSSEIITKESVVEAVMEIWKDGVLHPSIVEKSVKPITVNDTIVPVPSSSFEEKVIDIEDKDQVSDNVKETPEVIEVATISDSDTPVSLQDPAMKTMITDSKAKGSGKKHKKRRCNKLRRAKKKEKRLLNSISVISETPALTPITMAPPLPAPPMLPVYSTPAPGFPPTFPPAPPHYYPTASPLYLPPPALPLQQVVTPQYPIPNIPGVPPQDHPSPTPTSPISPPGPKRAMKQRPTKPKVHVSKDHLFSLIDKTDDITQLKAARNIVKEIIRVLPIQRDPKISWVDKESIHHAMDLLAAHLEDHNTIQLRKTVLKYGYHAIHPMFVPDTVNTRVDIDMVVQGSPQVVRVTEGRPDKLVANGYYSCWRSKANNRNICMQKLMVNSYNNKGEPSKFSGFDPDHIVLSTNLESSFHVHPEHRVTLFQWLHKAIKHLPPQKLKNAKQGNADFVIMKVKVSKPLSGLTGLPRELCECEFYEFNQANKAVSVNFKYPRGVDKVTTFLAEDHQLTPPIPRDLSNTIIDCD